MKELPLSILIDTIGFPIKSTSLLGKTLSDACRGDFQPSMLAEAQKKPIPYGILVLAAFMLFGGCQTPSKIARHETPATPLASSRPAAESGQIEPTQFVVDENESSQPTIDQPETVLPPEPAPVGQVAQSVESYIRLALGNHPRIRSARARVAAASHRVPQARALADPTLSNTFWPISDQSLQTAAGRAGNTMSLAQKYPWPEKRRAKAAVACREVQIARAQLSQVELEITEAVRLAYYDLWFAARAISITAENREIAAELISLAEARNAAGGSQQDVVRAELQLDLLDERLITLRQQKVVAQADLAALTQQPARTDIEPTEEIDVADVPGRVDALFAAAEECSPQLQEKLWQLSRDRQKRRLACLNRYPDFTLGAGWTTITETDAVSPVANGHDAVNFAVGVTLPIWRSRINASIRESSANVIASSRAYDDSRDDTFRRIRRFSEQALAADEQHRLYQERILPRVKRALHLSSADYRGQLVDFGEVVDNFTELLMYELQSARAKATLAGKLAQLERAVGCEVVFEE